MSRADGPRIRAKIISTIWFNQDQTTLNSLHASLVEEVSCSTIPGVRFHLKVLENEGMIEPGQWTKNIQLSLMGKICAQYMEVANQSQSIFERRIREIFGSWSQKYGKYVTEMAVRLDAEYAEKRQFLIRRKPAARINGATGQAAREPEQKATSVEVVRVAKSCRSNTEAAKELDLSDSAFRERICFIIKKAYEEV